MTNILTDYASQAGSYEAVWTLEIQTVAEDTDRILDSIMEVHPLAYGRYRRNASISAPGRETAQPTEGTVTETHLDDFRLGGTETYPMVELKISIERDLDVLAQVTEAILDAHHYEEPVIFLREDWVSRANYDPHSKNPNRWWNNGRGLPQRIS